LKAGAQNNYKEIAMAWSCYVFTTAY